ncbi:MAG: hypothetical protein OXH69_25035 [Acidobacteria bacterium]|nr:hypothetical protein [Acidobacteriota bacterium]
MRGRREEDTLERQQALVDLAEGDLDAAEPPVDAVETRLQPVDAGVRCVDAGAEFGADLTLTAPRYGTVEPAHLAAAFRRPAPARLRTLAAAREDLERSMVRDALDRHRSVPAAAGELGLTRQGLSRMMARLEIDRAEPARDRPGGGRSR